MSLSTHRYSLIFTSLLLLSSCTAQNNPPSAVIQVPINNSGAQIQEDEPVKVATTVDEFKTAAKENSQKSNDNTTMDSFRKLKMSIVGIKMNGASMYPTLQDNTILRVNTYFTGVTSGDLVVIEVDKDMFAKRIIGIPWDTLQFSEGKIFLKKNNDTEFSEIKESYLSEINIDKTYLPELEKQDTFTIPENMYWVMGDNRQNTSDSRSCFGFCSWEDPKEHFIDKSQILGIIIL